jgi:hypothetical protein
MAQAGFIEVSAGPGKTAFEQTAEALPVMRKHDEHLIP